MANIALPSRLPGYRATGVPQALNWARRYPVLPLGVLLLLLVIPAIFANQVAPHDPIDGTLDNRLLPPVWAKPTVVEGLVVKPGGSWEHPLGTDKVGRDILSRIIHGARVSLVVAAVSILCAGVVGTALG